MKRDMDLIRRIMLAAENGQQFEESADQRTVAYHASLLVEAGLLRALVSNDEKGEPEAYVLKSPTWEGHEFLDATRDKSAWEHVKEKVGAAGVWTFGTLIEFGKSYAMAQAQKLTGGA